MGGKGFCVFQALCIGKYVFLNLDGSDDTVADTVYFETAWMLLFPFLLLFFKSRVLETVKKHVNLKQIFHQQYSINLPSPKGSWECAIELKYND